MIDLNKVKFAEEINGKPPIVREDLFLTDLEDLVGKTISVYWCKSGMERNTKNAEIDQFWDAVCDDLQGKKVREPADLITPTQVSVCGKLEQFPNDDFHFRVLHDDLNYSYFNLEDIHVVIKRKSYVSCICLKWSNT